MSMKDILDEIEREEAKKPKLVAEQSIQDVIMGAKHYYKLSDDETNIDLMKRVAGNICGCEGKYMSVTDVNYWMYDAMAWLMNNEIVSKHHIKDFILGNHDTQRRFLFDIEGDPRNAVEISFDFIFQTIRSCETTRLILNLNPELATDDDYIREIRRKFKTKYDEEYVEVSKDGEVLKRFDKKDRDYFDVCKDATNYIQKMSEEEHYNTMK